MKRLLVRIGLQSEHQAEGADPLARAVEKRELGLEPVIVAADLQIGRSLLNHSQVVLVRPLSEAADVRTDDHIVDAFRRRRVDHHDEDVLMRRDRALCEFLSVGGWTKLGVEWIGVRCILGAERSSRHGRLNLLRNFLETGLTAWAVAELDLDGAEPMRSTAQERLANDQISARDFASIG